MISFTMVIEVYNFPLPLVVTPKTIPPYCFHIKTVGESSNTMIIKRLPDHSWIGEMVTMKYFTKENIQLLGKIIESENQRMFPFG
jgi:hypothetical protein